MTATTQASDPEDPKGGGRFALGAVLAKARTRPEYQFFAVLPRAHRGLAALWWAMVVLRGLLPAAFTLAVGLLVDAVRHGRSPGPALLTLTAVFLSIQVMAPVHAQVSANLGEHLSSWLHDTLLRATTVPDGVAHLESPRLTDDFTLARDFDLGMAGPPLTLAMGFISAGLVEATAGLAQAAVLVGYHWWAAVLVATAWISTHWWLRDSAVWDRDSPEVIAAQRRAEYGYRLGVDPPAAKELRLFGLSEWTVARFAADRRRLVDLRWADTRLRLRPLHRALAVLFVANGLVFWLLARDAVSGDLGAGQVVVFAQAAIGAMLLAFGGLNWALPAGAAAVAAVLRIEREAAPMGRLPTQRRSAEALPSTQLVLENVHFSYPGESHPVLDGVDLTIEAGTSLAVVGLNGAGKTTLVKLLCRLYDPTGGRIEADGTDLREFEVASWRGRVTAVFQDFIRYELPLRDNVAPRGATDAQIEAALAAAGAEGIAELDTIMARGYRGGTDVSGGQWQRIALARAVCAVEQGAGLVILDEPTAQLDVRGETEVFDRVLRATRGRTTVLISHRFSTVRHADRICVLERGRVVELGSHDELMAARGRYHEMFTLQAAQFDETPKPDGTPEEGDHDVVTR
ncbi:ABC transporter ATP-binding protein [Streptomyces sp. NPDC026589]|uniref:ABC transporter ATP-binding protein n=1 Tax=Streptomyces sp. NPDC026589 TaxID=3155609 RepID=UPI0033ECEAF4